MYQLWCIYHNKTLIIRIYSHSRTLQQTLLDQSVLGTGFVASFPRGSPSSSCCLWQLAILQIAISYHNNKVSKVWSRRYEQHSNATGSNQRSVSRRIEAVGVRNQHQQGKRCPTWSDEPRRTRSRRIHGEKFSRTQCSQIVDEIYPLHTYKFGAAKRKPNDYHCLWRHCFGLCRKCTKTNDSNL